MYSNPQRGRLHLLYIFVYPKVQPVPWLIGHVSSNCLPLALHTKDGHVLPSCLPPQPITSYRLPRWPFETCPSRPALMQPCLDSGDQLASGPSWVQAFVSLFFFSPSKHTRVFCFLRALEPSQNRLISHVETHRQASARCVRQATKK